VAYYVPKRKRRKRNRRLVTISVPVLIIVAGGAWWLLRGGSKSESTANAGQTAAASEADIPIVTLDEQEKLEPLPSEPETRLAADEEVLKPALPGAQPADSPAIAQADPEPALEDPAAVRISNDARTDNTDIRDARQLIERGKPIEARHKLNALLSRSLTTTERQEVRSLLTRLADETIFSGRVIDGDPLTGTYVVQSRDRLVNIAPQYNVPYEALMRINNIHDAGRIRAGQRLKVVHGPFNVKIDKSDFRMDVYLGDLFVKSYRVGLGKNGTPEGVWKVTTRLKNPRYYPPASSPYKHEVAPGDPNNPLGDRWIGLEGIEGDAVNREGYGIHGTIEPESIGRAVSLGCIRMHNEDVEYLFDFLVPGRSKVTIVP